MAFDISDATVLITGGNTGLGKASAIELARRGARVVITSRDLGRGKIALDEIRSASGRDDVEMIQLDLGSLASVRLRAAEFLERWDRLDVLLNNAGVALTRGPRQETADGFEKQLGVNHIGHFLWTELLLPRLKASAPSRIVNVSSHAYLMAPEGLDFDDLQKTQNYKGFPRYGDSKLANIYFTIELAKRLAGSGVTVNAAHPGYVGTELGQARPEDQAPPKQQSASGGGKDAGPDLSSLGTPLTPEVGAETQVLLCAAPEVEGISGKYFADSAECQLTPVGADEASAARLWVETEKLIASVSG